MNPKILVCVTIYNEELELLERSLSGLMSNIEKFKNHGIMPYQIITVVIFDGMDKMHESVIKLFK